MQLRIKSLPEGSPYVGERIQSQAIQPCFFYPPQCVLRQILGYGGTLRIHVRQHIRKAALCHIFLVPPRSMGVGQRLEISLSFCVIGFRSMEPVWRGFIFYPRMCRTDMIR